MNKTENEPRPRIRLKLSSHDYVIEFLGITFLILLFALPAFYYNQLPERVPVHFNAAGDPDSFGSRPAMFFLPATGLFLYIVLTILTAFPHIYNYPVPITAENAEIQYRLATRLMRTLKAVVLILFLFISWMTVRTATGTASGLGRLFLPAFLFIITGVIFIYYKMSKGGRSHT